MMIVYKYSFHFFYFLLIYVEWIYMVDIRKCLLTQIERKPKDERTPSKISMVSQWVYWHFLWYYEWLTYLIEKILWVTCRQLYWGQDLLQSVIYFLHKLMKGRNTMRTLCELSHPVNFFSLSRENLVYGIL